MTSRAPGKLLLSGAYAVLRGAPAVVTAVDRYATADATRHASVLTPEVQEALQALQREGYGVTPEAAPWFDAEPLREAGRKLGLGSSAAILVASLWEIVTHLPGFSGRSTLDLREAIFERARAAHRTAQGGGSGADVAAATFGGTMVVRRNKDELYLEATPLLRELVVEVWSMNESARTSSFVAKVLAFSERDPRGFDVVFAPLVAASHQSANALRRENATDFVEGLRAQHVALVALGEAADLGIVLSSVQKLHALTDETACFLPSGSGGGDVSLYVGTAPSSATFRARAQAEGLHLLDLTLDAPGSGPVLEPRKDLGK